MEPPAGEALIKKGVPILLHEPLLHNGWAPEEHCLEQTLPGQMMMLCGDGRLQLLVGRSHEGGFNQCPYVKDIGTTRASSCWECLHYQRPIQRTIHIILQRFSQNIVGPYSFGTLTDKLCTLQEEREVVMLRHAVFHLSTCRFFVPTQLPSVLLHFSLFYPGLTATACAGNGIR